MRIVNIRLRNFVCFAGDQSFDLDPVVYGVVAERERAPESSNWAGKSTLLESIPFALYGWHRYRTEDEWITRGAPEGAVIVTFDDGFSVARERKRGKSTQLECTWVGEAGVERANGEAAQARIVEHVGLDQKDFFATCFFEQKRMSRIATATPGELRTIVSGWLELDRVDAGQASARVASATAEKGAERHAGERNALTAKIRTLFETVGVKTGDELKERVREGVALNTKRVAEAQEKEHLANNTIERQKSLRVVNDHKDRLAKLRKQKAAEEKVIASDPGAEAVEKEKALVAKLRLAFDTTHKSWSEKKLLASGAFDGKCPVAGIKCPVKDEINNDNARNEKLLKEARDARTRAEEALRSANNRLGEMSEMHDAAKAARRARPGEDERIAELEKSVAEAAAFDEDALAKAESDLRSARAAGAEAQRTLVILQRVGEDYEQLTREVVAAEKKLIEWERRATTEREAADAFKVARRRVAETSVAEIEVGANALLESAGIDLSLKVSWERDTKKGSVEQLRLELSDRSGAAEDLAGIAFSLSASAWLRAQRGAAWGVALIDEPFGALDAVNRRAFAAHFAALVKKSYGFEQAVVVAHNVDAIASFPGRIRVLAGASGSVVQVLK